jgi:hypothetical protein
MRYLKVLGLALMLVSFLPALLSAKPQYPATAVAWAAPDRDDWGRRDRDDRRYWRRRDRDDRRWRRRDRDDWRWRHRDRDGYWR